MILYRDLSREKYYLPLELIFMPEYWEGGGVRVKD